MGDDTTDPGRAVGNDSLFAADREGWESDAAHQITTTDGTLWNDNVFDRLEGGRQAIEAVPDALAFDHS